ncbi:RNA-directed DNA polymerase (Reverse transcriptase), partial [Trifolium medium]|nr:RNA-directed DNA polymerase (Reverse transcriptase) [Trifolium medium]
GKFSGLQALKLLFVNYANCSGFNVGSLPFNYLGVPVFKGRPKASYFLPLTDRIKDKLSAWKASLLSIAGRTQLVKSVIQSYKSSLSSSLLSGISSELMVIVDNSRWQVGNGKSIQLWEDS